MNLRTDRLLRGTALCGIAIAAAVLCAPVSAQIVTQPPVKAPPIDEFIPKPPPPAPAAPRPINPRPKPDRPADIVLPDLPYQPLLERDAAGNAKPLMEPTELAALRRNPMVKPEEIAAAEKYLGERRASFERLVIDSLDLIDKVEGGLFENADFAKKDAFNALIDATKPLRAPAAPASLTDELKKRGLLTAEQAAFSAKIVKEYHQATLPPASPDVPAPVHAKKSLAIIYKRGVAEPLFVHRQLQIETSRGLSATIPALGLDKKKADALLAKAKSLKPASNDDARLAVMAEISKDLTIDQRKELFRKTIANRSGG